MSKYISTQDLADRLEELENELDNLEKAVDDADEEDDIDSTQEELSDWLEENNGELKELTSLKEEIGSAWGDETLIPEDEWESYVQDLCEDCGYIAKDFPWWIEIDWTATAKNVAQDYSVVTYQEWDYYVRSY